MNALVILLGWAAALVTPMADVGRVSVDWTAGEITATGAAARDLRAPSIEIARVRTEEVAHARAAELLAQGALALPWAGGKTVGQAARGIDGARARLARVVAKPPIRRVSYASDGGTEVTLGLPLALVASALVPARQGVPPDEAPVFIVVDARAVAGLSPVVGLGIRAGDKTYFGPVSWVDDPDDARKLATGKALRLEARARQGNVQTVDAPPDVMALLPDARPWVIVLSVGDTP